MAGGGGSPQHEELYESVTVLGRLRTTAVHGQLCCCPMQTHCFQFGLHHYIPPLFNLRKKHRLSSQDHRSRTSDGDLTWLFSFSVPVLGPPSGYSSLT